MLWSRSVEKQSEAIINSTYCHFLCLISLQTTCVKPYTFLAAQIQVIIFLIIGLLVQYIIIVADLFHNSIHTCILFSSRDSTGCDF